MLLIEQTFDNLRYYIKIYHDERKNRVITKIKKRSLQWEDDAYIVYFNGFMSKILGYKTDAKDSTLRISRRHHTAEARFSPNIHAYTPKSIIITCDIVGDTIFGGERLKLLRLITNKMDRLGDLIHYDFLHDEYVDLRTHEFERITIRLSDVTGELLKVDYKEIETRLQLEFKQREST